MKVVNIDGQLGRQMFQYAFFLAIKAKFKNAHMTGKQFLPATVFNHLQNADFTIQKMILPWQNNPYKNFTIINEPADKSFSKNIIDNSPENAIFKGEWLSYKYFDNIENQIRDSFKFTSPMPLNHSALLQNITSAANETVSMHVMANNKSTCTPDYYNWAVANINTFVPDAAFTVFTDNLRWTKKNITGLPAGTIFTDCNDIPPSTMIRLMSAADHTIISSTLQDWWAAYLNNNPDKIIIAPQRWNNTCTPPDLLPMHWTLIPVT